MPEGRSHDSLLSSRPTHCLMAVAISDTHPHTQPLTHTALSLAAHQEPKVRHFSTSEAETRVSHTASVRPCCTYTTVMLPTDPVSPHTASEAHHPAAVANHAGLPLGEDAHKTVKAKRGVNTGRPGQGTEPSTAAPSAAPPLHMGLTEKSLPPAP